MRRFSLLLGWTLLTLAGEKAPPPPVDVQATEYIAVYECKQGHLKLTWHDEDLEPEEIKELKQKEGKPCRVER